MSEEKNAHRELAVQACELAGMIEGLSVIHDAIIDGNGGSVMLQRAKCSLGLMFDAVIAKAWALTEAIENTEKAA